MPNGNTLFTKKEKAKDKAAPPPGPQQRFEAARAVPIGTRGARDLSTVDARIRNFDYTDYLNLSNLGSLLRQAALPDATLATEGIEAGGAAAHGNRGTLAELVIKAFEVVDRDIVTAPTAEELAAMRDVANHNTENRGNYAAGGFARPPELRQPEARLGEYFRRNDESVQRQNREAGKDVEDIRRSVVLDTLRPR